MQTITIGTRVQVVNGHGESMPLTLHLGTGHVLDVFEQHGESCAHVEFLSPFSMDDGGASTIEGVWPVRLLRRIGR